MQNNSSSLSWILATCQNSLSWSTIDKMAHLMRLAETVSDRKIQQCLLELNELISNVQSTSLNGVIRSVPKQPRGKETFTTVLRVDGMMNKWIDQDVDTKTDCFLELGKLHSLCENGTHCKDDSDDEPILTVAEIAEISASYFVSFGIQVSSGFAIFRIF